MSKRTATTVLTALLAALMPIVVHVGGFNPTFGAREPAGWAIALAWLLALAAFGVGAFLLAQSSPKTGAFRHWLFVVLAFVVLAPLTLFLLVRLVSALALVLALPYALLVVGVGARSFAAD